MSLFNEKLKQITLKEVLSLIIVLFLIQYLFNWLNIVHIDAVWIYILVIFYFAFRLKDVILNMGEDIRGLFSPNLLKISLIVVVLNIFFSYGMLYLSNFVLDVASSRNLFNSFLTAGMIATIFVSPISEELIFRGVFLNRLKLIVPTTFAVLISSLLFASLHSYGSIFSAFIFGICVAILYLKTDNIFVPIFVHFVNNLFAEIIRYSDLNNLLFTSTPVIAAMSVLAAVSFAVIFVNIIRQLKSLK